MPKSDSFWKGLLDTDGKQEARKRDSVKSSRWGQWKGQVNDVKKDVNFRENTGSENKV